MADSATPPDSLPAHADPNDAAPRTRLRQLRIEALAARMAASEGPLRAVLEQRLQQLRAAPERSTPQHPPQPGAGPAPANGLAALADLLATLRAGNRQRPPEAVPPSPGAAPGQEADEAGGGVFAPLPALQAARQTWARLRMDEHLRHVMAEVPDDAGPMHSTVLVHRAIAVMHEAAPGYLQHFLGHADALAALERISPAPAATPVPRSPRAPRSPTTGKASRSRPRGRRKPG